MDPFVASLAERLLAGGEACHREEALRLTGGSTELGDLLYWAERLRRKHSGNRIKSCAIVSARTGACSEDCAFCAQSSKHQAGIAAHGFIAPAEVRKGAEEARKAGAIGYAPVISGAGPRDADLEQLCGYLREVAAAGVEAHASFGILTEAQVVRLKAAGLRCYNHNLETSRRFFPQICTTHTYDQRRATLVALRKHGVRVCSGGLFGMGETWEDRVDLALDLRAIGSHNIPMNFLNALPGTGLAGRGGIAPLEALRTIALFRFTLADCDIGIYGGREANLRDLQSLIFMAGANALMLGNYLTTQGRPAAADRQMIRDLGLELVDGSKCEA